MLLMTYYARKELIDAKEYKKYLQATLSANQLQANTDLMYYGWVLVDYHDYPEKYH